MRDLEGLAAGPLAWPLLSGSAYADCGHGSLWIFVLVATPESPAIGGIVCCFWPGMAFFDMAAAAFEARMLASIAMENAGRGSEPGNTVLHRLIHGPT
jgi:hypothetical protein